MQKKQNQKNSLSHEVRSCRRKQGASYRIDVTGVIAPDWSDRLGGLRIESRAGPDPNEPVTVLEGFIQDQAQLSGILNTLYGLHCKLLSVKRIKT